MRAGKNRHMILGGVLLCSALSAGQQTQQQTQRDAAIDALIAQKNCVKPEINASNVFFADASYLLWRMHEDNTSYAIMFSSIDSSEAVASVPAYSYQELDFNWDSGFRVGMGYRMPYDAWELGVSWTRLHSRAHGPKLTRSSSDATFIRSNWLPNVAVNAPDNPLTFSAALKVHLNVLDGEIARFFQATSHLSFKPHVGVRGLWVTQSYLLSSTGGAFDNVGLLLSSSNQTSSRCRGVGLRAGLDTAWEFCKDWSVYGNIGGSLLSAAFNLLSKVSYSPVSDRNKSFTDNWYATIIPTLDLGLGLAWEHSFSGKAALGIRAGWEFNDFFNQNKMTDFGTSTTSSSLNSSIHSDDLTYQGLTLNVRLDF